MTRVHVTNEGVTFVMRTGAKQTGSFNLTLIMLALSTYHNGFNNTGVRPGSNDIIMHTHCCRMCNNATHIFSGD